MTFDEIIEKIKQERIRQDEIYGVQKHSNMRWFQILRDEVDELRILLYYVPPLSPSETIQSYIIQVIAVAINWLEHYAQNN